MKKIFIVVLMFLFTLNAPAQWYNRTYGVNQLTELSETQLNLALQQANRNVNTGRILTGAGVGAEVIGIALMYSGFCIFDCSPAEIARANTGAVLFLAGFVCMGVGIPIWVVNAGRRNKLEIALVNLASASYSDMYRVANPGFKQTSAPGLSLKINF